VNSLHGMLKHHGLKCVLIKQRIEHVPIVYIVYTILQCVGQYNLFGSVWSKNIKHSLQCKFNNKRVIHT